MQGAARPPLTRWLALLATLPALPAAAFILYYFHVAANRLLYPFELEWMEGGSVDHVARILNGELLYVKPSIAFVPYIYNPFYYYVCALVSLIIGPGLLPLRLVSLLATLATFLLLGDLVRRETQNAAAGLAAAGFYAASYAQSEYWFELARVDSLALALLLGGAWLVRFRHTSRGMFAAGVLLGLSYLTKQTMLLPAGAVGLWAILVHGRRGLLAALGGGLVVGGGSLYLMLRCPDWYVYYTLVLPRLHRTWTVGWRVVWDVMVTRPAGLAAIGAALAFALQRPRQGSLPAVLLVSVLVQSTLSMMHSWAAKNVLMPGWAGLALGFGLAIHYARLGLERAPQGSILRAAVRACAVAGVALACHQLWQLRYDARPQLTTEADRAAGRKVIARLKEVEGEVYIPNHGYLATLAGKKTYAHAMGILDILRSSDSAGARALRAEISQALHSGRFAAILADQPGTQLAIFDVSYPEYRIEKDLLAGVDGFRMRSGNPIRASFLYLRQ